MYVHNIYLIRYAKIWTYVLSPDDLIIYNNYGHDINLNPFHIAVLMDETIVFLGVEVAQSGGPGFQSRQRKDFSLLHNVQTGSGAHPASYPMHTGGDFPGRNAVGARS
jgi:hypothetical protein